MNDATPQYHAPMIDDRPYSKLAIWSLVLGILFLCLGPLGLVPLIMGIVAMTLTGTSGTRRGLGLAIAGTSLGTVAILGTCMSVGIFLPALGKARLRANELHSQGQIRELVRAAQLYADDHGDRFPPVDAWPGALIDPGLIDEDLLISPLEDGDGVSYIYLGGPADFDAMRIVIYEDPKHFEDGVLVGFADRHIDMVDHASFERMLQDQLDAENAGP